MYRRRARQGQKILDVPFGSLRLDVGDHEASDGTLRIVENLRPAGPTRTPYYTPTPPAVPWYDASALTGTVVALGRQVRNTRGEWSDQQDSSLKRIVCVTSSNIYLIDEDNAFRVTEVYDFGDDDTTRKAQFATIAETLIIAISSGDEPEVVLQLRDDTCFDYNPPGLPDVGFSITSSASADALAQGYYAYRYAYELIDGSIVNAGEARVMYAPNAGGNIVGFRVHREGVGMDENWRKLIRRLLIYMTQKSEEAAAADNAHLVGLMNSPFHEVASMSDITQGSTALFADTNESILGNALLDDTNLLQHSVLAAAVFSYNRQVVMGDISYDFRDPGYFGIFTDASTGEGVPIISGPGTYAPGLPYAGATIGFIKGQSGSEYWEVNHDVAAGYIKTINVVIADFDYQIERWNGTGWDTTGCPAANTDYDDSGGTYQYNRMRVKVTENGAVSESPLGLRLLTIDAASDLGFEAAQFKTVLAVTS